MGSKSLSNSKKKNKKSNKSKDERNVPSSAAEQTSISHDRDKKKIITDTRFSSVHSDPRFQNVPKHKAKVAIDSRFDRMFVDKRFSSSSAPLDKRGRPKKGKSENPLRHYYKIEEKSEKGEDDSEEDVEVEKEEEDDSDTVRSNVEVEKKNQRLEKPDSSSELEESESEDDDAETGESDYTTDTDAGDLDEIYDDETPELPVENIPEIDKETHRLAVVNLDWRHVKAVDLYVVLSSFLPKGGQILSVAVYPSEFGLQRMKEEELHGPIGLFDDEQEENDEDDDEEMDNEKLRAYEMSRLRYYYAVVECDSIATADYLYKTCDGVEFERSSNVLDLRFIPDSMEFEHPPRDIATEAPSSYEVLNFHTPALQHSKIQLSWDEDEPQREKALKRKFNADQLADLELKEFLASDESESDNVSDDGVEDQTDKKRKKGDKYRALLQSDEDGEQDGGQDMEVTFNTGLEDISKRILEKKDKKSETLWEAHLRKRREKRENAKNKSIRSSDDESSDTDREAGEEADDFFIEEPPVKESKKGRTKNIKDREHVGKDGEVEAEASRAELELLLADDEGVDTGIKGYNLKHKKKKGKEDIAEDKIPTVDYNDPRFSALFNSPLFALDPTDPQFKRSAAYVRQVALKQQKGDGYQLTKSEHGKFSTKQLAASGEDKAKDDVPVNTEGESSKKEKYELSSLVKSIKMKSKQLQLQSGGGKMPKEDGKKRLRATEEELQPPSTMNKSGKKKQRKMKVTAD